MNTHGDDTEPDRSGDARHAGPTAQGRIAAAAVCIAAVGVLAVAAWMEPAAGGMGTHKQLGLDACAWHAERGWVCPTCGMTTAFALAADGRLAAAARTQPAGAALAVLTAMAAWVAGYIAATGAPLWDRLRGVLRPVRMAAGLIVLIAAAWAYGVATR